MNVTMNWPYLIIYYFVSVIAEKEKECGRLGEVVAVIHVLSKLVSRLPPFLPITLEEVKDISIDTPYFLNAIMYDSIKSFESVLLSF